MDVNLLDFKISYILTVYSVICNIVIYCSYTEAMMENKTPYVLGKIQQAALDKFSEKAFLEHRTGKL